MKRSDPRDEVRISGSGRIAGGDYRKIVVAGSGTITGDIRVEELTVAGTAKFEGDVETGKLKVTGSSRLAGRLDAETVTSRGSLAVDKRVKSDLFKSYGSLEVSKDLISGEIYLAVSAKIEGDVKGESFTSRGSFSVSGLLTADQIEVWLGSDNYAAEVGGEQIRITKKGLSLDLNRERVKGGVENLEKGLDRLGDKLGFELDLDEDRISRGITKLGKKLSSYVNRIPSGSLESEVLEGDSLELEGVKAKVVRGKSVVIGEGCVIDKVEYSDTIEVKEGSRVEEKVSL